jgi:hypothetical protein
LAGSQRALSLTTPQTTMAGNMNHKLIVVYDSFDDEDQLRWYAQHLATSDDHVAKIYLVLGESEDR